MFLGELNETEKTAFTVLASRFITQDGHKSEDEGLMLKEMQIEMGISTGLTDYYRKIPMRPMEFERDSDNLFAAFTSVKSRAIALLEMIGLGHADSNYCALEEEFINTMADAFGVDDGDIAAMENWVLRQMALVSEAREFMEEGN